AQGRWEAVAVGPGQAGPGVGAAVGHADHETVRELPLEAEVVDERAVGVDVPVDAAGPGPGAPDAPARVELPRGDHGIVEPERGTIAGADREDRLDRIADAERRRDQPRRGLPDPIGLA